MQIGSFINFEPLGIEQQLTVNTADTTIYISEEGAGSGTQLPEYGPGPTHPYLEGGGITPPDGPGAGTQLPSYGPGPTHPIIESGGVGPGYSYPSMENGGQSAQPPQWTA